MSGPIGGNYTVNLIVYTGVSSEGGLELESVIAIETSNSSINDNTAVIPVFTIEGCRPEVFSAVKRELELA